MKDLYLVRFNGKVGGYGSENYLLGIYDSEEKAKEVFETFLKDHSDVEEELDYDFAKPILKVGLNGTYDVEYDGFERYTTSIYLGGYTE